MIGETMRPRLKELVGRLMVDPELLTEIQRAPESVLDRYELTTEERAAVRHAVDRLTDTPPGRRAHALRIALLRRVAT
jgi:hypothetical protein